VRAITGGGGGEMWKVVICSRSVLQHAESWYAALMS